jgi:hypothetical protein
VREGGGASIATELVVAKINVSLMARVIFNYARPRFPVIFSPARPPTKLSLRLFLCPAKCANL